MMIEDHPCKGLMKAERNRQFFKRKEVISGSNAVRHRFARFNAF